MLRKIALMSIQKLLLTARLHRNQLLLFQMTRLRPQGRLLRPQGWILRPQGRILPLLQIFKMMEKVWTPFPERMKVLMERKIAKKQRLPWLV